MKTLLIRGGALALLCLALVGCQTSPAAKALAEEQITVLKSAQAANIAYGEVAVRFARAAANASKDEAKRDYEERKKLLIQLHSAQPAELAKEIETAKGLHDAELARIDEDVGMLEAKGKELAKAWPGLIAAQEELRRYLVTQRLDQKLAAEAGAALKLDQTKLESSANTLLDKLTALTSKP